jgi:hypothetical protein
MMAASVSMVYTDTDQIREQLLELPLIEGRSLTADALCEEIANELVKVQQERGSINRAYQRLTKRQGSHHHTTATTTTPSSFYLQGIIAFSENCQRRRFVERRLRQEQGLGKQDAVEIPPPGVPKDGPRLLMVVSSSSTNNGGGEEEERVVYGHGDDDDDNNNFDSSFTNTTDWKDDTNWADDLVADQEEQDRKRR